MGLPHPCLMLVTEPNKNLVSLVDQAVEGGVDVVQWSDPRTRIGKRDPILTGLVTTTRERALLIGAGDWETYARHGIRAVHLPERSVPVGVVKYRIGKGAMVGKSVISVADAAQAEANGADYVVVGPSSIPDSEGHTIPVDRDLLREICQTIHLSVVAGGVILESIAACIAAGAVGVTVSSHILQAAPREIATQYRIAIDAAWKSR